MKFLLSLAALAVTAPTLASAEPAFWCKEVNSGIDHGIFVNFSSPIRYATVSEQSIVGPRKLADLNCAYNTLPESHDGVNAPYLSCTEGAKRDAGYSVLLSASAGKITGTVYSISIAGAKAIAELQCGRF